MKKTMQTGTQLQRKKITKILTEQPPHMNTAVVSWSIFARNVSNGGTTEGTKGGMIVNGIVGCWIA